ncbi:MAG: hypothetical protein K0V04_06840, partial [Deltaproteobacteria bacterium]|nr:hypothetical protein [Deltaproteobacteria bacterium]
MNWFQSCRVGSSACLGLGLVSLTLGCSIPKLVGDGAQDDASGGGTESPATGSETDAATDSVSGGVADTGGTTIDNDTMDDNGSATVATTGPPDECPPNPSFQCGVPFDCDEVSCGGPFSGVDEQGCVRPSCGGPEDCAAGEVCFTPFDYGGCASSGTFCEDIEGVCECGSTPDCSGSYCLPEDQAPSGACWGHQEEQSCLAAGCDHFELVTVFNDDCSCDLAVPACLGFANGAGASGAPNAFFHVESQTVAVFSGDWIELPEGWDRCT